MKALILPLMALLAGCAVVSHVSPYIAPAKILYCAAASPEERKWIREQYGLPQLIYCAADFTPEEVAEAQEALDDGV